MIIPDGLPLGRLAIRPISLDGIHPSFFVGEDYIERNDLLPVAKVQMAGFAPGCTFREEHQFKQILIVIKGSEYNGVLAVSAESLEFG